jgi:hypothetical protein
MTPKEKAIELANKMCCTSDVFKPNLLSIKNALKVVDEIIYILPNINETPPDKRLSEDKYFQYWVIVKQEIEKL